MSCSGSKLFENIFQYLILNLKARSSDVKDWTPESIHHAMDWAIYVEKVCMDVNNKTWKQALQDKLTDLGKCPLPWSDGDLELSSLSSASKSMLTTLLCNGSLPQSCVEACFMYKNCSLSYAVEKVGEEVYNTAKASSLFENQQRTAKYKASGHVLLNYMKSRLAAFDCHSSSRDRQMSRFVKQLLQLLCKQSSYSFNIFLGSLLSTATSEEAVQEDICIIHILNHITTADLTGADVDLLVECSSRYYTVWDRWMSWLLSHEAETPESTQFASKEVEKELVKHLIGLLSSRDPVRSASLTRLQEHSSISLAWTKIMVMADTYKNLSSTS